MRAYYAYPASFTPPGGGRARRAIVVAVNETQAREVVSGYLRSQGITNADDFDTGRLEEATAPMCLSIDLA